MFPAQTLAILLTFLLFPEEALACKPSSQAAAGSQSSQDNENQASPTNVMSIGFEGMNDGFSYHQDTVITAVLIVFAAAIGIFLACYFSKKYKFCQVPRQTDNNDRSQWRNISLRTLSRQYQNRFEDLGPVGVTPVYTPPPPSTSEASSRAKIRLESRLSALENALKDEK